jgi:hypothetical protein
MYSIDQRPVMFVPTSIWLWRDGRSAATYAPGHNMQLSFSSYHGLVNPDRLWTWRRLAGCWELETSSMEFPSCRISIVQSRGAGKIEIHRDHPANAMHAY